MQEDARLADIDFTENGRVDPDELNALYRLIGWDPGARRTAEETQEMLGVSRYHVTARTSAARLIGFARVCGDPYVAQVLDVVTHPEYRRRGVATRCMHGVIGHLQRSRYVSVTLTHGGRLADFYERFGFHVVKDTARSWRPSTGRGSTIRTTA